ncbi:MAG: helix-turn-helix transcriptional regulator [Selenomonadaceae bacterium]|nr:helix-turn-helix transcriptional regulator [Selenomonadaceae bacterium]
MELHERIKKARKDAGYKSRDALAEILGSTRNAINEYEQGRVVPNDVFLQLMATKLHISYEWLKNGVGEMFLKTDGNILSELAEEFTLSDKQKAVISAFLKLTDEQKDAIIEAISAVAAEMEQLDAEKQTPAPAVEEPKTYKEELTEEEHNLLEKHRRSMELRKRAAG